ncbi:MAG: ribosome maturation factor RimM [Methylocella sp.]
MDDRRLLVGRFGAPHGVRGEVRLQSFTGDPGAIAGYRELSDASGARRFAIKSLRRVKDNLFVAKIDGIADRSSAERLTNVELYLSRASLPAPAEEEFYLADLIGLAALDESRTPMGRVANVLDFGGGDILEIAPPGGGETLLFPFTRAVVPEIDIAGGWLVIAPPVEIAAEAGGPEPNIADGEDEAPGSRRRAPAGEA